MVVDPVFRNSQRHRVNETLDSIRRILYIERMKDKDEEVQKRRADRIVRRWNRHTLEVLREQTEIFIDSVVAGTKSDGTEVRIAHQTIEDIYEHND